MRLITRAIVIFLIICLSIAFIVYLPSTITNIGFYSDAIKEPGNFLERGNEFSYVWWGDQYGKGDWSGYHWHFEEHGSLKITQVENDVIKGVIEGCGKREDNYGSNDYTFYGTFTYFLSNNTLIEHFATNYKNNVKIESRYSQGPWFYLGTNTSTASIMNNTFKNIGTRIISVHYVPIRTYVYYRSDSNASYYEDNIMFYGRLTEKYCFDVRSKVLVYYELAYYDMWNSYQYAGWDYKEYFKLTTISVGLSVAVQDDMRSLYYIVVVLLSMIVVLLSFLLIVVSIIVDRKLTEHKFYKTLKDIQEMQEKYSPKKLEPYEPKLIFTGWLRPGFVVFEAASGSHVLVDFTAKKDHSLSPSQIRAIKALLNFESLNQGQLDTLDYLNMKTGSIDLSAEPPAPDSVLISRLRAKTARDLVVTRKYLGEIAMSKSKIEELFEFAYTIASFRKILTDRYGQAYINPPNNVYRAVQLFEKSRGSEVILIGDDDLLSLLLAWLGNRVTVVDVDKYTLRLIYFLAKKYDLENYITLYNHDIRIPFELGRQFFVAHIDPGYTVDGMLLFMSRALQNLQLGGYLFISWIGRGAYEDILRLAFRHHGLELVDKSPFHIKYIVPIPGYYAHSYSKYSTTTFFVGPTIKVINWKSRFYVCRYHGQFGYAVGSDSSYTGVLY